MARLTRPDIAGVWFAFRGDQACLGESVRAFRRLYGEAAPVCVFDDAADPMQDDFIRDLAPALYSRTTWDRHRNLNGPECVLGVLECFAQAADATGARWICKVDSDTIIADNWADLESTAAFQGIYWWPRALATGCNYLLRWDAPRKLRSWLAVRDILVKGPRWAEDVTISFYATVVFPQGVIIRHDGGTARRRIAGGYRYAPTPASFEVFRGYAIANFGDRYQLPAAWSDSRKREEVAVTMARFNDWVVAGCPREAGGKAAAGVRG